LLWRFARILKNGEDIVCDYSLLGGPNRLAAEGEQLVTYRFPTGSVGLAAPMDIAAANRPKSQGNWWSVLKHWMNLEMKFDQIPAVCIPPGAHLFMNHVPEMLRRRFALQAVEDVTFVQLSADAFGYRDGVQFRNGKQTLLQEISESVHFEVLSLASSPGRTEGEPQRVPGPGPRAS
jgi:hypothetical protein